MVSAEIPGFSLTVIAYLRPIFSERPRREIQSSDVMGITDFVRGKQRVFDGNDNSAKTLFIGSLDHWSGAAIFRADFGTRSLTRAAAPRDVSTTNGRLSATSRSFSRI